MAQPVIQPSFAAGELSPSLYARVDLAKYHTGAALLRNFFVDYRGGVSNRTGTLYVGRCIDSSKPNRLIPFTFSTTQTYALVFGDKTMRVVMNGGFVLEPSFNISGITQANPGVITATGHNFANGDTVFLNGIGGMTQLNEKTCLVANAATNTFTLTDLDGNAINTTGYTAYTSGGTVARVYTLTTPYAAADLATLKYTQSADTMTLCHPGYAPQHLTRTQHYSWSITPITYQPNISAPAGAAATASGTGTTVYQYVVTAIGANGVTESLPSNVASVTGATLTKTSGAKNTITWNAVTGATMYNVYRTPENDGGSPVQGALYGFVGSVTAGTNNSFIDNNINPDFTSCPPQGYNPFANGNNPGCTTYFQQRQVFAGMANNPEGLVFSKSGDYLNMNYSTPSKADDSIEVTVASQKVNAIKHLIPLNSLLVLTASGAWRLDGGSQADVITPSKVVATPQVYTGCSDVAPLVINYDILYVQSKGSIVRDLAYNFYVNIYTGSDLTVLANHLFYGKQIVEWAYAEEPYKIIWCVRDDGVLLSLTYLKEQEIYGWTHHDTQGLFKSVCSITEGQEDAVYLIVERYINGKYLQYVERMASRQMGGDPTQNIPADVTRAWFVDCGLQYPLVSPNATLTPSATSGIPQIGNVTVIAGGTGYTSPTVVVTDPTGSGATFTATVSNGVITAINVTNGGQNYTRPTLTINDPTGTGAQAAAKVVRPVTMTANSAIFTSADVGKVVRVNQGSGTVLSQTGSTVSVDLQYNLANIWPAPPNTWTMTTPVKTVTGLDNLNGQTVSILADGNVQPQQVVQNGAVTLDRAATCITVGLPYTAQFQSLYIEIEGGPTIQSKRKKINAVTVRVQNTRGLKAGMTFNALSEFKERNTQPMGQPIALITGDERVLVQSQWNVQGQVCLQQDNPLPATILGLIPELSVGDT